MVKFGQKIAHLERDCLWRLFFKSSKWIRFRFYSDSMSKFRNSTMLLIHSLTKEKRKQIPRTLPFSLSTYHWFKLFLLGFCNFILWIAAIPFKWLYGQLFTHFNPTVVVTVLQSNLKSIFNCIMYGMVMIMIIVYTYWMIG